MLDARGLGARERVSADEALVGADPASSALGGADVRDDALGPGRGERVADALGERADGRGHEHDVGAVDGVRELVRRGVDRAALRARRRARADRCR